MNQDYEDAVILTYRDIQDESIIDDYVTISNKEARKLMMSDVKAIKKYNGTVLDVDKEDLFIAVSY